MHRVFSSQSTFSLKKIKTKQNNSLKMFKLIVVCAFIGFATALSPNVLRRVGGGGGASHASSDDVHAEVHLLKSEVRPDGFDSAVQTSNGIEQSASGDVHGNIHGSYSWISPEGEHIQVQYVADENGYQPQSNVLPTPPPIPEAILRAIAYIEAHPPKEDKYHH